ncbi:FAD dependent oxidoreductase [Mucilaginibacter gracilis]|uniref:FAD dependent oxidoreductase n=1 Tax=Mucilaginibacter gracilis TaxID=423350 RepID=A0A495IY06_9SPHI|nr:FAD-dependent oxidoreductase [Mucilaginibacter gracilis]RKR81452.1 FAD dependent oxidoreductase [Mucilaginibacter gracilis]
MVKKILLILIISGFTVAYGQTIKTDVVVIGGGASGVAAGIQAARSNTKTLIVEAGPWLGGSLTAGANCIVDANRNLPSGIWGEFRKHVRQFYKNVPGFDTIANAPLRFEPYTGAAILKKITDTVKHLTVKINTPFTAIKKNGDTWELTITENGKPVTVKARVVIDATETGDVAAKAGAKFDVGFDSKKTTGEAIAPGDALPLIQEITWIAILKDYGAGTNHTIAKPEGYNAADYACLKDKDIKKMLADGKLPNDKYMVKWGECANSFPVTMHNLEPENRDAFYKQAKLHTLGLVYFIETELGFKNLGLDPKEFDTADGLPYIPYIREARRTVGLIRMAMDDITAPYDNPSKLYYRTSIGVGDASPGQHYAADSGAPKTNYPPMPGYSIPMGAVVIKDIDNLLVTEKALSVTHLVNASSFYPSVQMTLGQGVGTIAAYCAFFKTTTKHLEVRKIQIELLDYKGYLMPFVDVNQTHRYFRAVQQIGATGMLRGVQIANGKTASVYFLPDSAVKTSEIKPVMLDLYTRSFLWFNKAKPGEVFTVGNLLSFISEMTLADPETLKKNLQSFWKTKYKFTTDFNTERPITRLEFAVLANIYINPFGRMVDITGRFVN